MEDRIRGIISFLTRSPDVSLTWQPRDWSAGLVWRYTLFQIPALALLLIILIVIQQWIAMPAWLVWGLVIIWIIKDVALFPVTWRAYDWDDARKANSMVGRQGVVQEQLSPEGSVRVRGELWRARITEEGSPIDKGEAVRVREICGLTLVVEKVAEEHHLKDQKN